MFASVIYTPRRTPEYIAPEVIQGAGHGIAVDYWALGILIFEMVCGYPPFFADNPFTLYQKILKGGVKFPMSPRVARSTQGVIRGLLSVNRATRLGCTGSVLSKSSGEKKASKQEEGGEEGEAEEEEDGGGGETTGSAGAAAMAIKDRGFQSLANHGYFRGVDWQSAERQLIVPPITPSVSGDGDTANFDYYPEEATEEISNLATAERAMFRDFERIVGRTPEF